MAMGGRRGNALAAALLALAASAALSALPASLAVTSPYVRPAPRTTLSLRKNNDDDDAADGRTPQQVHISMVGPDKMRVTWITDDDAPAIVEYGTASGQYPFSATGNTTTYSYVLYDSDKIHDAVISPLQPSTTYYYRCSSNPSREFSFRTPPATLPVKFVIVGDLGQTEWTESTLKHIAAAHYDVLLLPGDLSSADSVQPWWDSYGSLVEPLASMRPWMVTQGNHEVEKLPLLEQMPFKAYNTWWRMPYDAGAMPSGDNPYYSFDVASGVVHVVMLGSYTDYAAGSAQYEWLQCDLATFGGRRGGMVLAFVVALVHVPWYSSNEVHRGDGDAMRGAMEALLCGNSGARGVDTVFAGHVHAYERFACMYVEEEDPCAPMYITVGDGGNRKGLAGEYADPQPAISAFSEASFGHGRLEVVNAMHVLWAWHRNNDDELVLADQVWITSLTANPACHRSKN